MASTQTNVTVNLRNQGPVEIKQKFTVSSKQAKYLMDFRSTSDPNISLASIRRIGPSAYFLLLDEKVYNSPDFDSIRDQLTTQEIDGRVFARLRIQKNMDTPPIDLKADENEFTVIVDAKDVETKKFCCKINATGIELALNPEQKGPTAAYRSQKSNGEIDPINVEMKPECIKMALMESDGMVSGLEFESLPKYLSKAFLDAVREEQKSKSQNLEPIEIFSETTREGKTRTCTLLAFDTETNINNNTKSAQETVYLVSEELDGQQVATYLLDNGKLKPLKNISTEVSVDKNTRKVTGTYIFLELENTTDIQRGIELKTVNGKIGPHELLKIKAVEKLFYGKELDHSGAKGKRVSARNVGTKENPVYIDAGGTRKYKQIKSDGNTYRSHIDLDSGEQSETEPVPEYVPGDDEGLFVNIDEGYESVEETSKNSDLYNKTENTESDNGAGAPSSETVVQAEQTSTEEAVLPAAETVGENEENRRKHMSQETLAGLANILNQLEPLTKQINQLSQEILDRNDLLYNRETGLSRMRRIIKSEEGDWDQIKQQLEGLAQHDKRIADILQENLDMAELYGRLSSLETILSTEIYETMDPLDNCCRENYRLNKQLDSLLKKDEIDEPLKEQLKELSSLAGRLYSYAISWEITWLARNPKRCERILEIIAQVREQVPDLSASDTSEKTAATAKDAEDGVGIAVVDEAEPVSEATSDGETTDETTESAPGEHVETETPSVDTPSEEHSEESVEEPDSEDEFGEEDVEEAATPEEHAFVKPEAGKAASPKGDVKPKKLNPDWGLTAVMLAIVAIIAAPLLLGGLALIAIIPAMAVAAAGAVWYGVVSTMQDPKRDFANSVLGPAIQKAKQHAKEKEAFLEKDKALYAAAQESSYLENLIASKNKRLLSPELDEEERNQILADLSELENQLAASEQRQRALQDEQDEKLVSMDEATFRSMLLDPKISDEKLNDIVSRYSPAVVRRCLMQNMSPALTKQWMSRLTPETLEALQNANENYIATVVTLTQNQEQRDDVVYQRGQLDNALMFSEGVLSSTAADKTISPVISESGKKHDDILYRQTLSYLTDKQKGTVRVAVDGYTKLKESTDTKISRRKLWETIQTAVKNAAGSRVIGDEIPALKGKKLTETSYGEIKAAVARLTEKDVEKAAKIIGLNQAEYLVGIRRGLAHNRPEENIDKRYDRKMKRLDNKASKIENKAAKNSDKLDAKKRAAQEKLNKKLANMDKEHAGRARSAKEIENLAKKKKALQDKHNAKFKAKQDEIDAKKQADLKANNDKKLLRENNRVAAVKQQETVSKDKVLKRSERLGGLLAARLASAPRTLVETDTPLRETEVAHAHSATEIATEH